MKAISVRRRCFLALGMFAAAATFAQSRPSEDLLAVLKAAQRANRESMRTFSATMVVEAETPDKKRTNTLKCSYWRTPTAARCRESYPGGRIEDSLQTASEHKQVGKHPLPDGKGAQFGATRAPSVKSRMPGDVWATMMIDFPNGKGGECDLERFLDLATKPPTVKKERLDGHDCLHLTAHYDDAQSGEIRLDAWFDPKENYLVRKRVLSWAKIRSESLIPSFQRIGEWSFPEVCVGQMIVAGKSLGQAYATFSDIKVNAPLAVNTFRLAVPSGTILFDQFDNTRYQVNERWERIGPTTPIPLVKSTPPRSDGDAPLFTEQSREEPPSRMRWLFWGSLALLGLGGCVWTWRNRGRLKRQES